MKICHEESGVIYEISELKEGYELKDSRNNRTYTFKESYEAIWFVIELIRSSSLEKLTEHDVAAILQKSQVTVETVPKSLMTQLKKEKITHTYYDQLFLKLLTSYRCGHPEITVSNKTNFILSHELHFIVRKLAGVKLSIPSVKA